MVDRLMVQGCLMKEKKERKRGQEPTLFNLQGQVVFCFGGFVPLRELLIPKDHRGKKCPMQIFYRPLFENNSGPKPKTWIVSVCVSSLKSGVSIPFVLEDRFTDRFRPSP